MAAWAYMCKGYTVKDWMAFAEIYGMPFRMGRYENTATEDDIAVLRSGGLQYWQRRRGGLSKVDGSGAFRSGQQVRQRGFFTRFWPNTWMIRSARAYWDKPHPAAERPGKLGDEKLQSDVRDDIRDDDAEQLAETLNRDLVKPFIDLNWGPQEDYPCIIIAQPDAEDVQTLITGVKELVPFGLRVEQSVIARQAGHSGPRPQRPSRKTCCNRQPARQLRRYRNHNPP